MTSCLCSAGDGSSFLSTAECQYIIKHELDTLRARDETHIPGYSQAKLYPGKSISECDHNQSEMQHRQYYDTFVRCVLLVQVVKVLVTMVPWDSLMSHCHVALCLSVCDRNPKSVCDVSVRRLQSRKILVQIFPLHEKEQLKRLSFSWYKKLKPSCQPLGQRLF